MQPGESENGSSTPLNKDKANDEEHSQQVCSKRKKLCFSVAHPFESARVRKSVKKAGLRFLLLVSPSLHYFSLSQPAYHHWHGEHVPI